MNQNMVKHGYKLFGLAVMSIFLGFIFQDAQFFFFIVLVPILSIFGMYFVIKGRRLQPVTPKVHNPYAVPNTLLLASAICLLIIMYILFSIRKSAGYSGSEAELAVIPFTLTLYFLFPVTLVLYIIVFIRQKRNK